MTVDFSQPLPVNFKPASHGIPYMRALRFFCEPSVRWQCLGKWHAVLREKVETAANTDGAWEAAEQDTLMRLRSGSLWGYGRAQTAVQTFRRIDPDEWKGVPVRLPDGILRVGATCFHQLHLHNPEAIPLDMARLAFGPAELSDEFAERYANRRYISPDPDELERLLFSNLAAGILIGEGSPLTPIVLTKTSFNFGFRTARNDYPMYRPNTSELYHELLRGSPIVIPREWWRIDRIRLGDQHLEADGRLFGDLGVRQPSPVAGDAVSRLSMPPSSTPKATDKAVRAWFKDRVETWPAGTAFPAEAADFAAAKNVFGNGLTRVELRIVIRDLAPLGWRKQGRRKGTKPAA